MLTKLKPDYVDTDGDFKPLPKYGRLSQKIPEYAAAETAINAAYSRFWNSPDWPSFRELAGNPDAAIPPGGPDRYRDVTTELIQFPARDGHMLELKVYKSPQVTPDATLMLRMHGGGWVVGNHEVDGAENVYAAVHREIVVVSIEYRLAPELQFPGPLHDCYDGLLWCKKNANAFGVDPEKIIVSGSTAGASLAAAITLEARDKGITGIVGQVLHFPSTCHPKFFPQDKYEFGSWVQNKDNPVLGVLRMEAFLDAHAPNAEPDHRHSPLLGTSLKSLPPARKLLSTPYSPHLNPLLLALASSIS